MRAFWAWLVAPVLVGCGAGSDPLSGGSGTSDAGSDFELGEVVINEICPNAECQVPDPDDVTDGVQESVDWIELHNRSNVPVDLEGYLLADSLTQSGNPQYSVRFPRGLVVQPDGYLVLYADWDLEAGLQHLPFRIGIADILTLAAPIAAGDPWPPDSGVLHDSVRIVDQVSFVPGTGSSTQSFARVPNGTGVHAWCTATPGESNAAASCE